MKRQTWNQPPLKLAKTTHQKIVKGLDRSNWVARILLKNKTTKGRLSRWTTIMILNVARLKRCIGQK